MLQERFVTLTPSQQDYKQQYKQQVFDMLQKAYADQGGMHGSGFGSPDDMVAHIPLWKMVRRNGEIVAVAMYKDTQGRKRVAVATNGTDLGKKGLADIMINDLTQGRSYGEISGKSLAFLKKQIDVQPYLIPFETAAKILATRGDSIEKPQQDDPEMIRNPDLADFLYSRKIGADIHTKVMVGTPNKKIV